MKLKRVLSLCLAAATVATCSSVVSAADENTTSFGTPISLTTGAEVEELTAGDFVAISCRCYNINRYINFLDT